MRGGTEEEWTRRRVAGFRAGLEAKVIGGFLETVSERLTGDGLI